MCSAGKRQVDSGGNGGGKSRSGSRTELCFIIVKYEGCAAGKATTEQIIFSARGTVKLVKRPQKEIQLINIL